MTAFWGLSQADEQAEEGDLQRERERHISGIRNERGRDRDRDRGRGGREGSEGRGRERKERTSSYCGFSNLSSVLFSLMTLGCITHFPSLGSMTVLNSYSKNFFFTLTALKRFLFLEAKNALLRIFFFKTQTAPSFERNTL